MKSFENDDLNENFQTKAANMNLSIPNLKIEFLHDINGRIYDENEIGRGYTFNHSMCCIKNSLYFNHFTHKQIQDKQIQDIIFENGSV